MPAAMVATEFDLESRSPETRGLSVRGCRDHAVLVGVLWVYFLPRKLLVSFAHAVGLLLKVLDIVAMRDTVAIIYNLFAHATVISNLLSLRATELLCTGVESLVKIVLLTSTLSVVVHLG